MLDGAATNQAVRSATAAAAAQAGNKATRSITAEAKPRFASTPHTPHPTHIPEPRDAQPDVTCPWLGHKNATEWLSRTSCLCARGKPGTSQGLPGLPPQKGIVRWSVQHASVGNGCCRVPATATREPTAPGCRPGSLSSGASWHWLPAGCAGSRSSRQRQPWARDSCLLRLCPFSIC